MNRQNYSPDLAEKKANEPFEGVQDVLLFHERHFAVDLRKLQLVKNR